MSEEIKYWTHQHEANTLAEPLPGFGFFMEMGTGKTGAAILRLRTLMNEQRRIVRGIIFTPPLVVPQFKEEFAKFSKLDPKHITLLQGEGKKRLATFEKKAFDSDGNPLPGLFITNYETLLMGGKRDKKTRKYVPGPMFQALQRWAPETVVFDEAHKLKSWEAERSNLAYHLANPWDMVRRQFSEKPKTYLLTGTPVLNGPLDLFQLVKVMLGGWPETAWFHSPHPDNLISNPFHFRNKYFADRNAAMPKDKYFPKWETKTCAKDGFDATGEIERTLKRISYRKTKEECLDLPEELSVTLNVGMTPAQAKAYKEMKSQLITYIGDKACVATMALTKALRMLQITAGFATVGGLGQEGDPADVRFTDTPKDEMLAELVESITPHSKLLIWAVWKENYGAIRAVLDKLGIKYVEAHGGITDAKKRSNVELFKTDDSVRVFIGHPGSGGVGLNLVEANYDIFYSRNFSLEQYLQARARTHRGGQKKKVTHYDLVCEGTIDELALVKLAAKIEVSEKLLGDLVKELAKQVSEY